MTGEQNRAAQPLNSKPDISEKDWKKTESSFIEIATSLIDEIKQQ